VLVIVLINIVWWEPMDVYETEAYSKKESRLRMDNLRQAEILFQKKFGRYTDNADTLINFIKTDKSVLEIRTKKDTLTGRVRDPFVKLTGGELFADSLKLSPKTFKPYLIQVDTSVINDTVRAGNRILRIDKKETIGTRYYIECPDGYGTIGSLTEEAYKNTASWE